MADGVSVISAANDALRHEYHDEAQKHSQFYHTMVDELLIIASKRISGTIIFNHYSPPYLDEMLTEMDKTAR